MGTPEPESHCGHHCSPRQGDTPQSNIFPFYQVCGHNYNHVYLECLAPCLVVQGWEDSQKLQRTCRTGVGRCDCECGRPEGRRGRPGRRCEVRPGRRTAGPGRPAGRGGTPARTGTTEEFYIAVQHRAGCCSTCMSLLSLPITALVEALATCPTSPAWPPARPAPCRGRFCPKKRRNNIPLHGFPR